MADLKDSNLELGNDSEIAQADFLLTLSSSPSFQWCNATEVLSGGCPAHFDGTLCWSPTPSGETLNLSCPGDLPHYSTHILYKVSMDRSAVNCIDATYSSKGHFRIRADGQ
ncbi:growth hormone-releasing hormone receptor-like isoform X4 [Varroa destructor]|uniref:G-protein coupled receptors family 2 profile 1 domain-containing protein n=1 Tax=Varroa destructor TaxID=109461 RepID=A0A7M7KBN2_VARDE|nr:growth hormone-releasing hormone receptor-like isoform X4 [Varroa destructor]